MQIKYKPIGLLGGTFDPVHHGHLRIALELYQRFQWQEIRFIPCKQPVLNKTTHASAEQRVKMLQIAINQQPGFMIDQRELQRATPSYMIDTLISLRTDFPNHPLCLIMGYDALLGLPQWHCWQELLEYAHFVVIPRPTYVLPEQGEIAELIKLHQITHADQLNEKTAGYLFFAELAPLAISSTHIRAHIAQGYSPQYLLPQEVWEYIQAEKLYKG